MIFETLGTNRKHRWLVSGLEF